MYCHGIYIKEAGDLIGNALGQRIDLVLWSQGQLGKAATPLATDVLEVRTEMIGA
jgi:hypothetical protein